MGAKKSLISKEDEWSAEDSSCQDCDVAVCGIDHCTHLFKDTPDKKTYIFYHRAASRTTVKLGYSVSGSGSGNAGVNKGASGGGSGGFNYSKTTNKGDLMVKMLRKEGECHRCVKCFHDKHPTLLKSIALTVKGRAWLINSDATLHHPASYGDINGW